MMIQEKIKKKFPIKGYREGLLFSIGEESWKVVEDQLLRQIDERSDFFKGARLALDAGERVIGASELGHLRDQLSERGINLYGVIGKSIATQQVAASLGLFIEKEMYPQSKNESSAILAGGEPALIIRKTLRSGMLIKYPGHVVIDGDVNPGAEIQADGSVYIWGSLRGTVQAGAKGDENAVICTLRLDSNKVRIANIYQIEKNIFDKEKKSPIKIHIKNQSLVIDNWRMPILLK